MHGQYWALIHSNLKQQFFDWASVHILYKVSLPGVIKRNYKRRCYAESSSFDVKVWAYQNSSLSIKENKIQNDSLVVSHWTIKQYTMSMDRDPNDNVGTELSEIRFVWIFLTEYWFFIVYLRFKSQRKCLWRRGCFWTESWEVSHRQNRKQNL